MRLLFIDQYVNKSLNLELLELAILQGEDCLSELARCQVVVVISIKTFEMLID